MILGEDFGSRMKRLRRDYIFSPINIIAILMLSYAGIRGIANSCIDSSSQGLADEILSSPMPIVQVEEDPHKYNPSPNPRLDNPHHYVPKKQSNQ